MATAEVLNTRYNDQMLCACGCGEETPVSTMTSKRWGYVKGEPRKFVPGHHLRKTPHCYVIDENGCWVWQWTRTVGGYGHVWDSEKKRLIVAHRREWEAVNGPVPEGLDLDHLCRNRACCNPAHLEPVTRGTNIRRGEGAKLTIEKARRIKESSEPLKVLAKRYGVTMATISQIRRGKSWKDA